MNKVILVDYVDKGRYVQAVGLRVGYGERIAVCYRAPSVEELAPVWANTLRDHPKFTVKTRRV